MLAGALCVKSEARVRDWDRPLWRSLGGEIGGLPVDEDACGVRSTWIGPSGDVVIVGGAVVVVAACVVVAVGICTSERVGEAE